MAQFGQITLLGALICSALAMVSLLVGFRMRSRGEKLVNAGYVLTFVSTLLFTICCGILIYCFFAGNYSILYVLEEHSENTTAMGWLFKLAGLWGGSQGSLLFWTWLISIFASYIAIRRMSETDDLSNVALAVMAMVLVAFSCVLVFSSSNNPFQATPSNYLNADGSISSLVTGAGMNVLLEHWAMAIHPPMLFIGYAGLTVPFAYAIAALVVNDSSKRWVELCNGITVFAWLFLGAGIGLGAVWAYVVLGWGGYWGWDAVENASLLSWLVGVALIHSFTIYRKRGGFKRWAVLCACISFSFVVLGTFITRSGIVQSVHAFNGDPVSKWFFLVLIFVSLLAGIIGLCIRHGSFEASEEIESLTSKNTAYYFSNVIMMVCAVVLAYLTLSSAFPSWLPFGGQELSAGTYDALARPIGIIYLLLLAVCPMLSWRKTEGAEFRHNAKVPFICGLVVFAGLIAIFLTVLYPNYTATIAEGGKWRSGLMADGASWYYNGLAVLGLAVASMLFCNTVYLFIRGTRTRKANKGENTGEALLHLFTKSRAQSGGYLAHLGMSIILVGLIGSSMYVYEATPNLSTDVGSTVSIKGYTLQVVSVSSEVRDNGDQTDIVTLDVYGPDGNLIREISPSLLSVDSTQQNKLNASVISFPQEDLFVVYEGMNYDGSMSMDIRVNPLITWVWVGFGVLMAGALIAATARRVGRRDP